MRLHCLGTTGYHPSPSRQTACYYLPDLELVLDAGTGLHRLTEHLIREPKDRLDILLSHAHLDHVVGLTFLLDVMAVTSLKQVRIFGQPDKLAAVKDHLFHPLLFPVPLSLELHPLAGDEGHVKLPHCSFDYFPLEHPGGSIGMRIEAGGKRFAYVTDTTPKNDAQFIERLKDLDLLLHECYFSDKYQELSLRTGHSWLGAVTTIVEAVHPKRTLLIHVNPLAEVLAEDSGYTADHEALHMSFAEDGMVVDF